MKKNCIFTIVAKNYIGLAKILEKSVMQHNSVDFFIFVADDYKNITEDLNVIVAKEVININDSKYSEMTIKYDLTEFCTAIKPFCFNYLLKTYEKAIYLDPDILVYRSFESVFSRLDSYDIVVTPHISKCHINYKGDLPENQIIGTGIFNFGFAAFNNSKLSITILKWWGNKLLDLCFSDVYTYLYTDQHWMDLLPCYCGDRLFVLRDLGYNIAPWNYFEREIVSQETGKLKVRDRESKSSLAEIVFVHYSGYRYKNLLSGNIIQDKVLKEQKYPDIALILDYYKNALLENKEIFLNYIDLDYSYNYSTTRGNITYFQRRLYNGLLQNEVQIENSSFMDIINRKNIMPGNSHDLNVDKVSIHSAGILYDRKINMLNKILKVLFKIIGYNRYVILIKAMRYYSRFENHHFLIKSRDDR